MMRRSSDGGGGSSSGHDDCGGPALDSPPACRVVHLRVPAPAAIGGSPLAARQLGLCPEADVLVVITGTTIIGAGEEPPPRSHFLAQQTEKKQSAAAAAASAAASSVAVVVQQHGCAVSSGIVSRLVKKLVLGVLMNGHEAVLDALCSSPRSSGVPQQRRPGAAADRESLRLQRFARRCEEVIAFGLREAACRCPICLAPLPGGGRALPSGRLRPCEAAACAAAFEQSCRGSYCWGGDEEEAACAKGMQFEPLLASGGGGKTTSGVATELLLAWAASNAAVADTALRGSFQLYLSGSRGTCLRTAAFAFCPTDYSVPANARAVMLPCDARPAQEALARMHVALAALPTSLLDAGGGSCRSRQQQSGVFPSPSHCSWEEEQPQPQPLLPAAELGHALRHALAPQRCELLEVPLRARLPLRALLQLAVVHMHPAAEARRRAAAAPVLAFHGSPLCNWCAR